MDKVPLAVAYYPNGVNFRMSAERLNQNLEVNAAGQPTKLTAIPMYFLASQAAELFLKAALLKRGFVEADLKKHDRRHNLMALLQELQKKNVPVSSDTIAVVNGLSEQQKSSAQIHRIGG